MRKFLTFGGAMIAVLGSTVFAQPTSSPKTIEFEGRKWECHSADRIVVQKYRGKTALRIFGGYDTAVYLPDVEFQDGTIEVDIAPLDRLLPGIGIRGCDDGTWCNKILLNHWRGKNQDQGEFLEQAVVTRRNGTVLVLNIRRSGQDNTRDRMDGPDWFHVKAVLQADKVKVYLNGSDEPSIELGAMLDGNEKGVLGLCGGGYFANFQYTAAE